MLSRKVLVTCRCGILALRIRQLYHTAGTARKARLQPSVSHCDVLWVLATVLSMLKDASEQTNARG